MKKLLLTTVLLFPLVATAQVASVQPVRVPVLAQLQMLYTMLCEDVMGGSYGYTQTPSGPTGWSCEGGKLPADWRSR